MRLSQLARQLEIDAEKIVKHFAKEGIEVENSPNTKLTEDQIAIATKKFEVKKVVKTEKTEETTIKSAAEKLADLDAAKNDSEENTEAPAPEKVVDVEEKKPAKTKKTATPKKIVLEEEPKIIKAQLEKDPTIDDNAEVIKAPKVELGGIKVVGKINLPEKPVKETPKAQTEEVEEEVTPEVETPSAPEGPKIHPSKLAKQKAKEVISTTPEYLPPTPDEEPKRKVQTHQTEPSEKKSRRRPEKDYEPLWQKKQTYYSDTKATNTEPVTTSSKAEKSHPPKPKKKSWIGRFFQWWTTE